MTSSGSVPCSLSPKSVRNMVKLIGPGGLVHHRLQVLLGGVLAQGGQHVMQILVVDEAVPVVVDHVERLLELLDLVLVEHSEHIAGRPLSSFLRGATPSCGLSRRHLDFFISCRSESSNK